MIGMPNPDIEIVKYADKFKQEKFTKWETKLISD